MITKDSIETAYAFFHQKHRVYIYSNMDWQKDDIEYAIDSYIETMSPELFEKISAGRPDFLRNHLTFKDDLTKAVEILEEMTFAN